MLYHVHRFFVKNLPFSYISRCCIYAKDDYHRGIERVNFVFTIDNYYRDIERVNFVFTVRIIPLIKQANRYVPWSVN